MLKDGYDLQPFEFSAQNLPHDYHAVVSLPLAELIDCGFVDWNSDEWAWDYYNEEQRERLQKKIVARYYYREIGILPWAAWREQFIRKLNEIMPKYKLLYAVVDSDSFNLFQTEDVYGKNRHVFSDFPASILNGETHDYASNATDHEYEDVRVGDTLDKIVEIQQRYNDIDVMILDELEVLFSGLMTVNFNGF